MYVGGDRAIRAYVDVSHMHMKLYMVYVCVVCIFAPCVCGKKAA